MAMTDEQKADREIVIHAVQQQGNLLSSAHPKFLDDEEVVSIAIEKNFRAYTFATKRVQEIPHIKERFEKIKLFSD